MAFIEQMGWNTHSVTGMVTLTLLKLIRERDIEGVGRGDLHSHNVFLDLRITVLC